MDPNYIPVYEDRYGSAKDLGYEVLNTIYNANDFGLLVWYAFAKTVYDIERGTLKDILTRIRS